VPFLFLTDTLIKISNADVFLITNVISKELSTKAMSTKEKLIEKISSIKDPQILEEIDRWVSSVIEEAAAEHYTKKELDAVSEGYSQYKTGDTFTQSEANKIFDEWQKKK
jgi:predicted transcriptional regulator